MKYIKVRRRPISRGKFILKVIAIYILCVFVFLGFVYFPYKYERKVFSNIHELDMLEEYVIQEGEDPNIGDIPYLDGFCAVVGYRGDEYLVCAYVFPDTESLNAYYSAVWDHENERWDDYGIQSYGDPFHNEYFIYSGTCALHFKGDVSYRKAVQFENWLTASFSVEVPKYPTAYSGETAPEN